MATQRQRENDLFRRLAKLKGQFTAREGFIRHKWLKDIYGARACPVSALMPYRSRSNIHVRCQLVELGWGHEAAVDFLAAADGKFRMSGGDLRRRLLRVLGLCGKGEKDADTKAT